MDLRSEGYVPRTISHKIKSHLVWEIPNFLLDLNRYRLLKIPFSLYGVKCDFHLYLSFNNKLYLQMSKEISQRELNASVTFGIRKDGSVLKSYHGQRQFQKELDIWPIGVFLDLERHQWKNLKESKEGLTMFFNVLVLDDSSKDAAVDVACQTQFDGLEKLSQNFKDLFLDGDHGDITFKVQDKEFLAHKAVLSARSTVFRGMFGTEMIENNEGIINIIDSDPNHFKDLLLHVYSGKSDMVSPDNAFRLYMLADKYDFQELKSASTECLRSEMCVDSFCDVAILASLHGQTTLMEIVTKFFIENSSDIFQTVNWVPFMTEYSVLAGELLVKMGNRNKKRKWED